ncbi:MAG TPA: asparagine synthase (glutamine-hydrolyzing) [Dongiaceae bacterium]|jgi:asparagine synthase (glutamine-hydrolysing)|nr:asparagine synthase (glutamine-hydrolyzing) [Dongiaceae bacterium]
MCGLVGFLNFDRRFEPEQAQKIVRDMAETMHYRGPDMDGYWASTDNLCHLGHKRLSIIDLSEGGRQPMTDDSGRYVIVFNGEIYNFQELRDKLTESGVSFRTKSDTEVLLKGYIKLGAALFPQLDGMFALAIYDTQQRTMVLARDRAGEKPLYYRSEMGLFLFGSELHTLTKMPGLDWDMSAGAVALYMLYRYVPAPQSILEGVRKLKPGCMLTIDSKGKTFERRYYAFEVDPEAEATQEGFLQTCDRVEAAMIESLRRRLISDVPLGMFLSSGIDSSLVCALAAKKLGVVPRTFTIGFAGDDASEHLAARQIASHLGTNHSEHVFGAADFDSVGRSIGTLLDEPNGDRSCVPTYLLCKFAREQVTVALSGDGGDELFGGYGRYEAMSKKFGANTQDNPRATIGGYYNGALSVFGIDPIIQALPEARDTIDSELDVSLPLFQHPGRDVIHGLRQMDFAYYMPGAVLAKVDRMSMRSSLETRTPFFHQGLLSEAAGLPTQYCLNSKMAKLILREIAGRYLPRDIALLPKKGFGMPASVFLNNIKAVQLEMSKAFETLKATRFFGGRSKALNVMWQSENINATWAFIVLGQWARHFPVRL